MLHRISKIFVKAIRVSVKNARKMLVFTCFACETVLCNVSRESAEKIVRLEACIIQYAWDGFFESAVSYIAFDSASDSSYAKELVSSHIAGRYHLVRSVGCINVAEIMRL